MSQNSICLTPQKTVFNLSNNLSYEKEFLFQSLINDAKLIENSQTANIAKTSDFQLKAYEYSSLAHPVNNNSDELSLNKDRLSLNNSKEQKNSDFLGKYLTPFERFQLQKSLQEDLPKKYRQRIEIMLKADEGKNQIEIKKDLGCCQDTVRRWVLMARSGLALNWRENPIGRPKTVNDRYLERLKELVTHSPKEFGYCFRRWTANWLKKHLAKELNIEVSERHINRLLKQMGLSTKTKNNITPLKLCRKGIKIDDLKSDTVTK